MADKLFEIVAGRLSLDDVAARVTRPKSLVELPIIPMVTMRLERMEKETDDALWDEIAALHTDHAKLDDASRELIRRQNPDAAAAGH